MSMTLGAAAEPSHLIPNAYSSQDNHTVPSFANVNGEPPQYTRHEDNLHPEWPEGSSFCTAEHDANRAFSHDIKEVGKKIPKRNAHLIPESPSSEFYPTANDHGSLFKPAPLKRGLQIPSRMGRPTSGFRLPPLLQARGVSKEKWKLFTSELKGYAKMSGKQIAAHIGICIGINLAFSAFCSFLAGIPATVVTHNRHKRISLQNFATAEKSGVFEPFTRRWNETYFELLGLLVMIAMPEKGNMQDMDVTTSKLFRYQQKVGVTSSKAGADSGRGDQKEAKYQIREGHDRVKAAQKARIIIIPLNQVQLHRPQESGQVDVQDYFDDTHRVVNEGAANPLKGVPIPIVRPRESNLGVIAASGAMMT